MWRSACIFGNSLLSTWWWSRWNFSPSLGLVPWRSPSLGYAKKGRVGRLSRRPLGHGGCRVPMNRWTNAGGSIDGHLPTVWRMPYKRVYPSLTVGDAIDAFIPTHGEGYMAQAAALRMSLRVPARNEWTKWTSAPHDCDVPFECERRLYRRALSWMQQLVYGISWGTLQRLRSLWPKTVQKVVSVSGSAYWTQVLEPVWLRASPVCPCIPGLDKQRLGRRELE